MDVRAIAPHEVASRSLEVLGLDADYIDFSFPEALAEVARRVVSMRGPISKSAAVRLIREPLRGLPDVDAAMMESVPDVIEQLVSVGDLVECEIDRQGLNQATMLLIGMPRFVAISEHFVVLLGSRPDGVPPVSDEIATHIERNGSVRYIRFPEGQEADMLAQLRDEGVKEIKTEHWLRSPKIETTDLFLTRISSYLDAAIAPGELEGAVMFDSSQPRRHYRSRWRPLHRPPDGILVLRRPQAYGADRWSVARTEDGSVQRLVDLPLEGRGDRACDEAWRVMAAIDADSGSPGVVSVVPLSGKRARLDFDAPLPAWLQRHLTYFGYPVLRSNGALFSFSVEEDALGRIRELVEQKLWCDWTERRESPRE